jgi:Tol biopolymer transport system component
MRRLRSSIAHIGVGLCAVKLAFCAPVRESNESASLARCEYGPVQSLGPIVNSPAFDGSPTASADETELFFTSERKGLVDLFVSTRSRREASWTAPANLGPPVDDPSAADFSLRLSSGGNTLYFASTRSGGFGKADIYAATRASRQHPWGPAANLGPRRNTDAFEAFPTPTPDGSMLYFNRSTSFKRTLYFMQARPDSASGAACTPMTCFNRVDLYVAAVNCR